MNPTWIALILLCYFGLLMLISYLTSKGANNEGFFIGNRKSPWYIVAIGMIGASISAVTFISVPGWVTTSQFAYMQMVLGYLAGYQVIIWLLLPLYYKLRLTSIYGYLNQRFGYWSYKSGASFFLLSRTIGSAARLFLVSAVLQIAFFDTLHIPFVVNVLIIMGLIWLYTHKGGIRTIIWTDTVLALMFLTALALTVILIMKNLNLGWADMAGQIRETGLGKIFFWDDFGGDRRHFIKYFLGGMFITITMTGLDQDLMQKNLSCKTLKDSQKNMTWFSLSLIPINLLFLTLGALLILFARSRNIELPAASDSLYPMIATGGYLPPIVGMIFIVGIVAAAFSSSDSALTALTTSVTIDILDKEHAPEEVTRKVRNRVHILLTVIFVLIILLFRALNNRSIIDTIFTIAGYTYGPLLGLYAFGMFTRYEIRDRFVPAIVVLAPVLTFLIQHFSKQLVNYVFSFELLLINGMLTFFFLWLIRRRS